MVSRKKQNKPRTFLRKRKTGRKPTNSNSRATTVLKALSNSQRLEIISHLLNGEERSVKELEAILKTLSQSALSQHLGRLRRAHILKTRRDSQMIYYSIRDEEVEKIMDFLIDIYPDDPSLPY
ncbi:MAG: ArsR/SmtB family transcription factor [Candidatus Puniceispirillales bacterium]